MTTVYKKRRIELLKKLENTQVGPTIAIIYSGITMTRSNDSTFPFRQNSDFFYLTGFHEDNAILVLTPKGNFKEHLFVQKRDPTLELWTGIRTGKERAQTELEITATYDHDCFKTTLVDLIKGHNGLAIDLFEQGEQLPWLTSLMATGSRKKRRGGDISPEHLINLRETVGMMRLIKDDHEIEQIKKAAHATEVAYHNMLSFVKSAKTERDLQNILEINFRLNADTTAYESIVASGVNGNILHYIENNSKISKDDLILIDAASEYGLYASDVTRTFPASGKFSVPQREVYEVVLTALKEATKLATSGKTLRQLHECASKILGEGLFKLGIISSINEENLKLYFPHGTSHWLGLDVHDNCPYLDDKGNPLTLQPGMCFTIEPGLYLNRPEVPEKYRGIAIRIEDDILVTQTGNEVLTAGIPKEMTAIEEAMAKPFVLPI